MKRILPLLMTLSLAPVIYAAPATPTKPTSTQPAKPADIDPAAKALLNQSAAAYKALNGLSMNFSIFNNNPKNPPSKGSILFDRSGKGHSEVKQAATTMTVVSDGKNLWMQYEPAIYRKLPLPGTQAAPIVFSVVPSLGTYLPLLVEGKDILETPYLKFESVTLLPNSGVKIKASLMNTIGMTTSLYFDPTDHLIRRAENTTVYKGRTNSDVTVISDVQLNPAFSNNSFVFTPIKGSKPYVEPVNTKEPKMYDPKLVVGAAPFALKGKDLAGKTHTFSEFKGKVVLLDFWATWCGPCVGELPNVLANYKTYHPKGFEIVGVSLDEDKKALTDFIQSHDMKYSNLFDGKGWENIDGKSYKVQSIPFSLLIGKDGKIAAVNPRGDLLEPAIKAALAKK